MAGRHIFVVIVVIGLSADFTRGFWGTEQYNCLQLHYYYTICYIV